MLSVGVGGKTHAEISARLRLVLKKSSGKLWNCYLDGFKSTGQVWSNPDKKKAAAKVT